jgi:hypothetical protein
MENSVSVKNRPDLVICNWFKIRVRFRAGANVINNIIF